MGTRGILGFITPEGEVRGSYNHFDSYPSGLGRELQEQVRKLEPSWDHLRTALAEMRWVGGSDEPTTNAERAKYAPLTDGKVSSGTDWYSILRHAQGRLDLMLEHRIAVANHDFARDSLFCEWGYLFDLGNEEVVILEGFNRDPEKEAPYCKTTEGGKHFGCMELWRGSMEDFLALDMSALEEADDA